ncbi:MAG: hypothetical protein HY720_32935 [Planctomycetes bacterium]|nr:hypothetical protein [Planctomycetota bacterium]
MKRTYRFASPHGSVSCLLENGEEVLLPLFQGILRHPRAAELPALLAGHAVARKYTRLAIQFAAWPVLRRFPRRWLIQCLPGAILSSGRRRGLEFLLGISAGDASPS